MIHPELKQSVGIIEIERLTSAGTLGFYTQVEATEIIAFPPNAGQPVNLLTLLVAEERSAKSTVQPYFLNPSRIRLPGLRDWYFGICRYTLPLDDLVPSVERAIASRIWAASGAELRHAAVTARPPQFVPPDSIQQVPWNRVLKNNFWNGSYVIEWADTEKAALKPFFTAPHLLQVLSDAIHDHVPIRLASLSDRLGNIIVQLPVTVLMTRFSGQRDGSLVTETGWHPQARPRPLRASVELEFDNIITGYQSSPVDSERTILSTPPGPGSHRGILWDDANGLVLAATGPSAFVHTIAMNLQPIAPEPRVFCLVDENGMAHNHRIRIHSSIKSLIGPSENDGNQGWTRRRIYRNETSELVRERRFVQYRPEPGRQNAEHERALNDIRRLIAQHGEEGAWLWDPYLSARDILKTLFFSPYSGSDLRGLTARKESLDQASETASSDFFQEQRNTFANAQSNFYGMRLEFRAKVGPSGWDFHDRFLIFPNKETGARAWSLGTSINGVGKAHHILQHVDDGQQVMDAFVELWDQLNGVEHLVWKVPSK